MLYCSSSTESVLFFLIVIFVIEFECNLSLFFQVVVLHLHGRVLLFLIRLYRFCFGSFFLSFITVFFIIDLFIRNNAGNIKYFITLFQRNEFYTLSVMAYNLHLFYRVP